MNCQGVIDWVATGYGYPRWMVALLFDLAVLEARALKAPRAVVLN